MSERAANMKSGKLQLKPRGRWRKCLYEEREDGTALAIVGGKLYLIPSERIKEK